MSNRLDAQMAFLMEADKLKEFQRNEQICQR